MYCNDIGRAIVRPLGQKMLKILKLILRIVIYVAIILAVLYLVSTFKRVF